MAENHDKVILFFDKYSSGSRKLHESFRMAGCEYPVVVIEEDGFLPDGVKSIYGFFLEENQIQPCKKARPKRYEDFSLEQESEGNSLKARILPLDKEREELLYGWSVWPRIVKAVDWLNDSGVIRMTEHYDRYGVRYARTLYDSSGKRVSKSYYSICGQEIILEDYTGRGIFLLKDGERLFFQTKEDFVKFYFEQNHPEYTRLFYNTLAIPFIVSLRLGKPEKKDILFWKDSLGQGIPGNMQIILKGHAGRTEHIIVQDEQVYDRLIELGANPDRVHRLGFLYPFEKRRSKELETLIRTLKAEYVHRTEVLICTNSEQIEHCSEIVEGMPQIQFHIAALTTMSPKLMEMGSYENVRLWPNIRRKDMEELFYSCDFLLDINYGAEIVSAVRRAFLHDMLIFAFQETVHNREYVADEHVFPAAEAEDMIEKIEMLVKDREQFETSLLLQHAAAMAENDDPTGIMKYQMVQYLTD